MLTPSRFPDILQPLAALIAAAALGLPLAAQIRPTPLPGGGGGGIVLPPGFVLPGGGGAGGGGIVLPPGFVPPGGGVQNSTLFPTINAPSGILSGTNASATIRLGGNNVDPAIIANASYQWSISGGRIVGDSRSVTVNFVADNPGSVTLAATIGADGTSFAPTANVTVVAADTAGRVTSPATIAANATSVTASVPAAEGNDRTFRWAVAGGATIVTGQGTNTITFRPTSPGLKRLTCTVNFRNVVQVDLKSSVLALGTGAPVAVTVDGGDGGGTYPAGTPVTLIAHPPVPGMVFDRWTGDTAALGAGPILPQLSEVNLTVPTNPVRLQATYRAAPPWQPVIARNFNPQALPGATANAPAVTSTLAYHLPAFRPRGLVFLLHQSGGDLNEWFDRAHPSLLLRELVAAGYGVAALNSVNRVTGAWSGTAALGGNPDALNHVTALNYLARREELDPATPVFFVGRAAGAVAGVRYADLLLAAGRLVRGAVLYLSGGDETLAALSRVPQYFAVSANEEATGPTDLMEARARAQTLAGRGVPGGVVISDLTPLYPARLRMLGLQNPDRFTGEDATTVAAALRTAGIVDANLYPRTQPSVTALAALLPAPYRARAADVATELAIASGEREFFSGANRRVLAFLEARITGNPAPEPGRMINLSTRGDIAFLGDTLTAGFTLSAGAQANVLIRAVGPGLGRFRVGTPLAAAGLEVFRAGTSLGRNVGWENQPTPAARTQLIAATNAVGTFALGNGSLDSALLLTLDPGSYSVVVTGVGGATGEVMAEIYDVSRNASRLTNLSSLSRIGDGNEAVIPGVVVAGNTPRTVVLRAIGPGLVPFGQPAATVLSDPRLVLFSGVQPLANNNNWGQANGATLAAVFPVIGAFPLNSPNEAALLTTLTPGPYTLQASPAPGNAGNATGRVLVELYEVP